MRPIIWTEERLALLAKLYPTTMAIDLVDVFGTSAIAITQRANKMGLMKDKVFRQKIRSAVMKKAHLMHLANKTSKEEIVRTIHSGKLIIKGNVTTHIGA